EGNVHEPGDLFALAGRHGFIGEWKGSHEQRCAQWLACTGSGSRSVRKPGTIDEPDVQWTLDMARAVDLDSAQYGHSRMMAGRMTLADAALEEQARALIQRPLIAV